jgi:hypothetical protein
VRKISWLVVPGLLCALSTAACGDDDDDKSSKSGYVDALLETMEDSSFNFGDEETNKCMAAAMVDAVGVGNLQDEATPQEFAEADDLQELDLTIDGDVFWEKGNDCTDLDRIVVAGTDGNDDTLVDCVMDKTTEDQRQAYFVSVIESGADGLDEAAAEAISAAAEECSTEDVPTDDTTTDSTDTTVTE